MIKAKFRDNLIGMLLLDKKSWMHLEIFVNNSILIQAHIDLRKMHFFKTLTSPHFEGVPKT